VPAAETAQVLQLLGVSTPSAMTPSPSPSAMATVAWMIGDQARDVRISLTKLRSILSWLTGRGLQSAQEE
jgi:hypothetical protein